MKVLITSLVLTWCASLSAQDWGHWKVWGDTHDGYYQNPVLPADFSDIDCIEHDGVYYMISSTFQFQPGMIIMKSTDMVNWTLAGYAVKDIRQISPAMNYDVMDRYGRGIWAGAIRWFRGRFYVYFGTPDEGYFMTSAEKVEGPWDDLTKMSIGGGWDDPCPFFDELGNGYLIATQFSDNYKTYVFSLSRNYKDILPDSRRLIHQGAGREANKLYKRDGWFYHLYSEVNYEGRRLMIQRSRVASGPYEGARPMSEVQRQWHEPNQGGFLFDSDGRCFFLTHHGDGDWSGRIASLLPVTWTADGWPVIGQSNAQGIGEMVWRYPIPTVGIQRDQHKSTVGTQRRIQYWQRRTTKQTSPGSDFWEWNYYPREDKETVTRRAGLMRVRLEAFLPLERDNLLKVGNILSTRSWRTQHSRITVKLKLSQLADGQRAGICHFSGPWSMFGVEQAGRVRYLFFQSDSSSAHRLDALQGQHAKLIYLRTEWGLDGLSRYSFSFDGIHFRFADGCDYQLRWANYRGDRVGLFTYNNFLESGIATFDVLENRHDLLE
ncbi:MAG: family 43 glycosylhydrolase [Bacteroidaceae bacterium]|nr:family 43 glycosylhydrolase [Bacteroidaceae bacterium]